MTSRGFSLTAVRFAAFSFGSLFSVAPAVLGQINPNLGSPLGAGDETISVVTSSFPVTFPDGSVVTDLFVDSNGRVLIADAGPDFSETVMELLEVASSVDVLWDDLTAEGAGDVYFNDLGTSVLITWSDVVEFGAVAGSEFSIQLEILADSTFILRSDSRAPDSDGIVGVSAGNSAVDPGLTDISFDAPFDSGAVATIYERWAWIFNCFDLGGSETNFVPNGAGGYAVSTTAPAGSPRTIPPFPAVATMNGPACTPSAAMQDDLTFTPDGAGGYDVSATGVADLTFSLGLPLSPLDDGTVVQPLGFSFAMPGGVLVTEIEIDSNGRLFEPGGDVSDFTESILEFLSLPTSTIAPFWDDLNPSVTTGGGQVWFNWTATGVSITWDGVPEFPTVGANTFQVQLSPSGVISFHYLNMSATDGIVGLSSGNGAADPGSMALGAGGISTAGNPVVYQQFTGDNDLGYFAPPTFVAQTRPIVGTDFEVLISTSNPTIGEFYLLGNAASFDLSPFGIDCSVRTDSVLGTIPGLPGVSNSLALPNLAGLVGASLVVQGATIDLSAGNPFFVLFTNSVDFAIGDV